MSSVLLINHYNSYHSVIDSTSTPAIHKFKLNSAHRLFSYSITKGNIKKYVSQIVLMKSLRRKQPCDNFTIYKRPEMSEHVTEEFESF